MKEVPYKQFGYLLKKLRLKAEIATLTELGKLLASKGYVLEDSFLSHWQRGRKLPRRREVLLALITIFKERTESLMLEEINEFLESANQGNLTKKEVEILSLRDDKHTPFLVPPDIDNFVGRVDEINGIVANIAQKTILIEGQAGLGKTALAIKVSHSLKDQYPDGVLWFRLDVSTIERVLGAIAQLYGENITTLNDREIMSSFVRSLLSRKRALLVLDNVESEEQLRLLVPNTSLCNVIITTQRIDLTDQFSQHLRLTPFSHEETELLYETALHKEYTKKWREQLLAISDIVHNLPLPITLFAKQLAMKTFDIDYLHRKLKKNNIDLQNITYENKNLFQSIDISVSSLDVITKKVFLSLGVFGGKDFSVEAVSNINKLSQTKTFEILSKLKTRSLIESSTNSRYRLHPLFMQYLHKNKLDSKLYLCAIHFYTNLLKKYVDNKSKQYRIIEEDFENILYLFNIGNKLNLHNEILQLWKVFGLYLWDKGYWKLYKDYGKLAYEAAKKVNDVESQMLCTIQDLGWCCFWQGDIINAEKYIREGLILAEKHKSIKWIAFGNQRLGKIYQAKKQYKESNLVFKKALLDFTDLQENERIGDTLTYIGENYWLIQDFDQAHDYLQKALTIVDTINDFPQKAIIYSNLGGLHLATREYEKSNEYFSLSLSLAKKIKRNAGGLFWNTLGLGLVHHETNNLAQAEVLLTQAKEEMRKLGINKNTYNTSVFFLGLQVVIAKTSFMESPRFK